MFRTCAFPSFSRIPSFTAFQICIHRSKFFESLTIAINDFERNILHKPTANGFKTVRIDNIHDGIGSVE